MKIIKISVIFITVWGSLNAMSYRTYMDEQDAPITTDLPLRFLQIYRPNLCDDYAHFHPRQCKGCKYCLEKEKEQFKIFSEHEDCQ